MIDRMMRRVLRPIAISLACLGFAGRAWAAETFWHDTACRYRVRLNVGNIDGQGEAGYVDVPLPGRSPDGADIRVTAPNGRTVPHKIVFNGPASKVRLAFQTVSEGAYHVYWGNPRAKPPDPDWTPRVGLILTAKKYEKGGWNNVNEMLETIRINTHVFGRGRVENVWHAGNPFGPSDRYLSVYEGWLMITKDGEYGFCTASDDASFLFVNDRLVCQWPGGHGAYDGLWGQHNGRVQLKAGVHKIVYLHGEGEGDQAMLAGWMPPGEKQWKVIPPEAFVRFRPVAVDPAQEMTDGRPRMLPIFGWEVVDHWWNGEVNLIRMRLAAPDVAGAAYSWKLHDGTTLDGRVVEHLYFSEGERDVELTVTVAGETFRLVQRICAEPAWLQRNEAPQDRNEYVRKAQGMLEAPSLKFEPGEIFAAVSMRENLRPSHKAFVNLSGMLTPKPERDASLWIKARVELGQAGWTYWRDYARAYDLIIGGVPYSGARTELLFTAAGLALSGLEDEKKAAFCIEAIEKSKPSNALRPRIAVLRAELALLSNDVEKAREAVAALPHDAGPEYLAGAALLDAGNMIARKEYEAALQALDRFEQKNPRYYFSGASVAARAEALLGLMHYRPAKAVLSRYLALCPNDRLGARLNLLFVESLLKLGKRDEALKIAGIIAEKFPESEEKKLAMDIINGGKKNDGGGK